MELAECVLANVHRRVHASGERVRASKLGGCCRSQGDGVGGTGVEMAEWTGLGLDQDALQKETKQGLGNPGNGERQVKNCSRPCSLCSSAMGVSGNMGLCL